MTKLKIIVLFIFLSAFSGCQSIHVGGSGNIGGISGGGGISIPVPHK